MISNSHIGLMTFRTSGDHTGIRAIKQDDSAVTAHEKK